jgi:hypothetical protein
MQPSDQSDDAPYAQGGILCQVAANGSLPCHSPAKRCLAVRVAVSALALLLCAAPIAFTQPAKDTLTVDIVADAATLDP